MSVVDDVKSMFTSGAQGSDLPRPKKPSVNKRKGRALREAFDLTSGMAAVQGSKLIKPLLRSNNRRQGATSRQIEAVVAWLKKSKAARKLKRQVQRASRKANR
jgi:hypothetical protein